MPLNLNPKWWRDPIGGDGDNSQTGTPLADNTTENITARVARNWAFEINAAHVAHLDGHLPHFATVQARNTAIPNPVTGQLALVGTQAQRWDGTAWVPAVSGFVAFKLGDGTNGTDGHLYFTITDPPPAFTGATPAGWTDVGDVTGPPGHDGTGPANPSTDGANLITHGSDNLLSLPANRIVSNQPGESLAVTSGTQPHRMTFVHNPEKLTPPKPPLPGHVPIFADATARDAAIPTPVDGQIASTPVQYIGVHPHIHVAQGWRPLMSSESAGFTIANTVIPGGWQTVDTPMASPTVTWVVLDPGGRCHVTETGVYLVIVQFIGTIYAGGRITVQAQFSADVTNTIYWDLAKGASEPFGNTLTWMGFISAGENMLHLSVNGSATGVLSGRVQIIRNQ